MLNSYLLENYSTATTTFDPLILLCNNVAKQNPSYGIIYLLYINSQEASKNIKRAYTAASKLSHHLKT